MLTDVFFFHINISVHKMYMLPKLFNYLTFAFLLKFKDFSIYSDDIIVVDPSGVQLSGLNSYKNSFTFLQTLVGFLYCPSRSQTQSRMVYDFARQSIRISWNSVLVPKVLGNEKNALYIDGISVYKLGSKSGTILSHTVENLIINSTPVTPPYQFSTLLMSEILQPSRAPIPVGVGAMTSKQ